MQWKHLCGCRIPHHQLGRSCLITLTGQYILTNKYVNFIIKWASCIIIKKNCKGDAAYCDYVFSITINFKEWLASELRCDLILLMVHQKVPQTIFQLFHVLRLSASFTSPSSSGPHAPVTSGYMMEMAQR